MDVVPIEEGASLLIGKNGGRSPNVKEVTHYYRVPETFAAITYIECRLETGRTHQIRVHMDSIGHLILGDPV